MKISALGEANSLTFGGGTLNIDVTREVYPDKALGALLGESRSRTALASAVSTVGREADKAKQF